MVLILFDVRLWGADGGRRICGVGVYFLRRESIKLLLPLEECHKKIGVGKTENMAKEQENYQ